MNKGTFPLQPFFSNGHPVLEALVTKKAMDFSTAFGCSSLEIYSAGMFGLG
jgi:hypothetical protein